MTIKDILKNNPLFNTAYKVLRSYMWVMESKYYSTKTPKQRKDIVAKRYKKISGEELDWNNLLTYNEKIQWAKLYDDIPRKTKLADKYLVRDWVAEKIGESYLIPLLGVWDSFDEINFSKLPHQFVLKANHASGMNIIVSDKKKWDKKTANQLFDNWLKVNYAHFSFYQMQYEKIPPKIIAEEYLTDSNGELPEFKFFCFDGEVYFCWFILEGGNQRYGNIYDLQWNLQSWKFKGRDNTPYDLPKPANFEQMVEIAKELSQGFSHVRVDLYNVDGAIYFGEMTFTPSGGTRELTPKKYNKILGEQWKLEIHEGDR